MIHVPEIGERWHRVYFRGGQSRTQWDELRFFGPTDSRFDHHIEGEDGSPLLQNRGIVYCAEDILTCVAEVFQNARAVHPQTHSPSLAIFEFKKILNLIDFTGTFPLRLGASGKQMTGPRPHARRWSQAFYEVYPSVDGLYYRSSMTGKATIALYERAFGESTIDAQLIFHRSLSDPYLREALERICDEIGYSLLI